MAVAFSNVNGINTSGTTGSVGANMPTGTVAGNLLITEITVNADVTLTISAGWTIIHQVNSGSNVETFGVAWKIAVGSDASPTWSWGGVSHGYAMNVSRLTGAFTGAAGPIGNHQIAGPTTSTSAGCSGIVADSAAAFMFSQTGTLSAQTIPVPTGYTSDNSFATGAAPNGGERMSHKATTNVGDSSGSTVVTITSTRWHAHIIEIRSQAPPTAGTISQTLKLVTQTASGWAEALGSAAQMLKLITQAASGNATGALGTISQRLKLVTQSASGWHEIFGTAAQTLKLVTQSLAGNSIFGTAAQTLKRITQAAVGQQWTTGPIVQTLKLVQQSASGAMWAKGAAAMTLKVIRQSALGVLGAAIHGNIAQTLKLIRQTGIGQQWTTGPIVQTLKLVRQSAQGWHTIFGAAVQLLFRPQQLLNGFELTLDTLFAVSKVQLNAVVAAIEKQIRSTWHGPPDDPLPPLV